MTTATITRHEGELFATILNKDEKATAMLEKLASHALASGMTADEYLEARKTLVMLVIARSPKLLDELAEEVYNSLTTS